MRLYYKLNFYLNGEHWIEHPNGNKGEIHPHSWELSVKFTPKEKGNGHFEFFTELEEMIKNYLAIYEGQIINEMPPFDVINATLENMTKVFYKQIRNILDKNGFILINLTLSESPSRCIEVDATDDYEKIKNEITDKIQKDIISLTAFRKKKERETENPLRNVVTVGSIDNTNYKNNNINNRVNNSASNSINNSASNSINNSASNSINNSASNSINNSASNSINNSASKNRFKKFFDFFI